jgi:hypothetical protein
VAAFGVLWAGDDLGVSTGPSFRVVTAIVVVVVIVLVVLELALVLRWIGGCTTISMRDAASKRLNYLPDEAIRHATEWSEKFGALGFF